VVSEQWPVVSKVDFTTETQRKAVVWIGWSAQGPSRTYNFTFLMMFSVPLW